MLIIQKPSLGHVRFCGKFRPDRFSRFDVYWIQTDKQTDRQAKFIYRLYQKFRLPTTLNSEKFISQGFVNFLTRERQQIKWFLSWKAHKSSFFGHTPNIVDHNYQKKKKMCTVISGLEIQISIYVEEYFSRFY